MLAWIDRGHRILTGRTKRQMGLGDDKELGIWRRGRRVLVRVDEGGSSLQNRANGGWMLLDVGEDGGGPIVQLLARARWGLGIDVMLVDCR
ncbi:hypothetical protein ACLOJK_018851 [Asimina triloba]